MHALPQRVHQEEAGAALCHPKPDGMIVLGGAASVKVPLGSFVQCNESCSFKACTAELLGRILLRKVFRLPGWLVLLRQRRRVHAVRQGEFFRA